MPLEHHERDINKIPLSQGKQTVRRLKFFPKRHIIIVEPEKVGLSSISTLATLGQRHFFIVLLLSLNKTGLYYF